MWWEPNRIYKTNNGGYSWSVSNSGIPTYSFPYTFIFFDSNTGLVGFNHIYKTTNSGTNWFYFSGLASGYFYFVNHLRLYGLWGGNQIRVSQDNGNTWYDQVINVNHNFKGITFLNNDTGFIVGDIRYNA